MQTFWMSMLWFMFGLSKGLMCEWFMQKSDVWMTYKNSLLRNHIWFIIDLWFILFKIVTVTCVNKIVTMVNSNTPRYQMY